MKKKEHKKGFFESFANHATRFTGSSGAFIFAVGIVLVWAGSGPVFGFSETWQLVINTGTTIITFLMVFLIQKTQNKDSKAIHLKLNELLAAQEGASNRMVEIEDLSEEELDQLHKFYTHLAKLAKKDSDLLCSHSIDAADEINTEKIRQKPSRYKRRDGNHNAVKEQRPSARTAGKAIGGSSSSSSSSSSRASANGSANTNRRRRPSGGAKPSGGSAKTGGGKSE